LNSIVVLNFLFCFFKSYFYFIFNSTNKQNFRWSNRIITHVSVSKFLVKIVKGATKCKKGQTSGAKIAHLKVRGQNRTIGKLGRPKLQISQKFYTTSTCIQISELKIPWYFLSALVRNFPWEGFHRDFSFCHPTNYGARPYENIKIPLSVTYTTNTSQNTLQL
jgi:hypothetical protein